MKRQGASALVVGTLAVSTAGPLILLAGVPAFAFASWRLCSVALLMLPFVARSMMRDWGALGGRDRGLMLFAGLCYGAHFGLFTWAFDHTSKESVVVLIGVQPLIAAFVGRLWLKESITPKMIAASLLGLAGLAIFVWHDYAFDPMHLIGDVMTLVSGLVIVLSYTAGRTLRPKMSLGGYLGWLYATAGVMCVVVAVAVGESLFAYDTHQWFWLSLAILVPTLVGHSLFQYVVKYVPVFQVNLAILMEPVLALLIMFVLRFEFEVFRESTLAPAQILGGALLMVGVAMGLLTRRRKPEIKDEETVDAAIAGAVGVIPDAQHSPESE